MNAIQKATAAKRRVQTRHAIIEAASAIFEGLPVSIKETGSLKFLEDLSNTQFEMIANAVVNMSAQVTTLCNFAKCDLWRESTQRYHGGGMELMRIIYGNSDLAIRQAAVWKNIYKIGRRVPEQDRDMTRTWSYYRFEYDRPLITTPAAPVIYDLSVTTTQDSIIYDYNDQRGAKQHFEAPLKPTAKAIIERFTDCETGQLNLDF